MSNNTIKSELCQRADSLEKYTDKKEQNMKIAKYMYWEVGKMTLERYRNCGSYLAFVATREKDYTKLTTANFCQNRFCPMCNWRKSLKDSIEIGLMAKFISEKHKKAFIFLTLTTPNVIADGLDNEIREMNKGFDRLFKYKDVDQVVKGYVRKLEVTYNSKTNTYNPHIHVLIAVNKSYFTDKTYIAQHRWLDLWNKAMKRTDITQLDVRRVKPKNDGDDYMDAVLETAKYTVKGTDLAHSKPVFHVLYSALKGKRLLGYGKLFKEAKILLDQGELDYLRPVDENLYVWKLIQKWDYEIGEYQNDPWTELTVDEFEKINKKK